METNKRTYKIIIGSKAFFEDHVLQLQSKLDNEGDGCLIENFLELVRLSDECKQRGRPFSDDDKAAFMRIKNDNYHGIVESAHDRLGSLIEELTVEDATIYVHNPPTALQAYLEGLSERGKIGLSYEREKYEIKREPDKFHDNMEEINNRIFGQTEAIAEISKSMWYMTTVSRKKTICHYAVRRQQFRQVRIGTRDCREVL